MIEDFVLGILIGILIDAIWFRIDYPKYERGFEMFEHYHFGLIIGAFGLLFSQPILLGICPVLVFKESDQNHPFAIHSNHFKESTIIGLGMTAIFLAVYILLKFIKG